jgi:hypothetical protein
MGATTTNSVASSIATEWDKEMVIENRESQVLLPSVDMQPLVASGTRDITRLATTASLASISNGVNEADAGVADTLSTTNAQIRPNARALFVLSSWVMQAQSAVNWAQAIPGILGRAAAEDMESAAFALLGGFSRVADRSGLPNTLQNMLRAPTQLRIGSLSNAALGPICFVHDNQMADLDAENTSGVGVGLSPMLTRQDVMNVYGASPGSGLVQNFRGSVGSNIPIFVSTLVTNDGTNYDGAIILPKQALAGAYNWLATMGSASRAVVMELADVEFVSQCYAMGEKNDSKGVTIRSRVTA